MNAKYDKMNDIEICIYIILGVHYFQKLVFLLEKFIHRKDGGTNQNYHFTRNNMNPIEHFVRFLFFNGFIHFRNICLFLIYFGVKKFFFSFYWYDVLLVGMFIKDIYCVMLQRYNYLRMQKINLQLERKRKERINRKIEKLLPVFRENYNRLNLERDLELLHRINIAIVNKSTVCLDAEDELALKRLIDVMEKV